MYYLNSTTAILSLALLCLCGAPGKAKADLVIQGRAAQALECSALYFSAAEILHQAGYLSGTDADNVKYLAILILDYVPGTEAQKMQAMRQRFSKHFARMSDLELLAEWDRTSRWCTSKFLS